MKFKVESSCGKEERLCPSSDSGLPVYGSQPASQEKEEEQHPLSCSSHSVISTITKKQI